MCALSEFTIHVGLATLVVEIFKGEGGDVVGGELFWFCLLHHQELSKVYCYRSNIDILDVLFLNLQSTLV